MSGKVEEAYTLNQYWKVLLLPTMEALLAKVATIMDTHVSRYNAAMISTKWWL
jgi:hypothetical protein